MPNNAELKGGKNPGAKRYVKIRIKLTTKEYVSQAMCTTTKCSCKLSGIINVKEIASMQMQYVSNR